MSRSLPVAPVSLALLLPLTVFGLAACSTDDAATSNEVHADAGAHDGAADGALADRAEASLPDAPLDAAGDVRADGNAEVSDGSDDSDGARDDAGDASSDGSPDGTSASDSGYGDGALDGANDSSVDAGADIDANPEASDEDASSDDGGACNTLVNTAATVPIVAVPLDPPVLSGGVIVPGTYHVTEVLGYTGSGGTSGPTGDTVQETVQLTGTTTAFVITTGKTDGGLDPEQRGGGTYVVNGSKLTVTYTCGMVGSTDETYTSISTDAGPTTVQLLLFGNTYATLVKQ